MNKPTTPLRRSRAFVTVFLKEVRENLRDRRTILSAFLTGPLMGPLLFVMLVTFTINRDLDKAEKPMDVPVIGAQYAPNLIAALKESNIVAKPPIANPEAAVRNQDVDLVLRLSKGYDKAWRKGEQAQVEVIYDSSLRDANSAVKRVRDVVENYARQQGAMRLVARGLSPSVASPVVVADRDQATAQSRAALVFNMLPYFFVLTIFTGGMALAIDLTAGERERQSLEPLFANPAPRWKILLGKLAAICTFSTASLLISLATFALTGPLLPAEKIGMDFNLGGRFIGMVLVLELPMVMLMAGLQSMVAAFAKSYREAQTYLSLLLLLPILPSVALLVAPVKPQDWMYAVPLLGQHLGILDLLRGNAVLSTHLASCVGGTLATAIVVVAVTMGLYRSERLAISG